MYFEKVIKNENTHNIILCGKLDTVHPVDMVVAYGEDASEDGENSPPEPTTTRPSSSCATTQSSPGTIPEMTASRTTLVGATAAASAAASAAIVCFFRRLTEPRQNRQPLFGCGIYS